jgi:hypothetical protein
LVTLTISLATSKRLGSEHRPEDADHEVEALVIELVQVRSVALLKGEVGQAQFLCARLARRDQVAGDVDAKDVRAQLSCRHRGGPVPAAEIQHL